LLYDQLVAECRKRDAVDLDRIQIAEQEMLDMVSIKLKGPNQK
jgi:hypothetical protein